MSSNVYNISTPSYGVQTAQYSMDVNIMRTALILFLVIIVVVVLLNVLHLYARCVIRRRTRLHTISLVDVSITGGQTNSHEQPKHGLEPSVIFSLPTFPYRKSDRVHETDAKECTVCLGTLEDDEMVKLLPNCKHMFHVDCIDMWLHSNSTCPVCRTGAKPVEPTDDLQAPLELNETGDAVVRVDFPEDSSNTMIPSSETVQDVAAQSVKEEESGGSVSDRLSSLRRILSRGRSIRDNQQSGQPEGDGDLERQ